MQVLADLMAVMVLSVGCIHEVPRGIARDGQVEQRMAGPHFPLISGLAWAPCHGADSS